MTAYQAAVAHMPAKPRRAASGSLRALIDAYRQSAPWAALSAETRRQREAIFLHIIAKAGDEPAEALTAATIRRSMDARRETPEQANHFLKVLRGLFAWAVPDFVPVNPTIGIKLIRTKSEGHAPWTAEDVEAFRARWPLGTRERLAFDVLLYTGLRRGDAVRLGRQHVKDGIATIRTEKTGAEVTLPLEAPLRESIEATGLPGLTFIHKPDGSPYDKAAFGNWFRKVCNAAGIRGKAAHGLRKTDATSTAEGGASERELMARYGWASSKEASRYTASRDKKRLAIEAAKARMRGETGTAIHTPSKPLHAPKNK
ncbi:MAG: tyrosine-type recombinase/integrase [Pseudomonadota bacterium]|jgi:integrase